MAERKPKGVSNNAVRRGAGGVAGETLKRTGSAVRGATSAVSDATGTDAVKGVGEQVQQAAGATGGAVERAAGRGEQRTMADELRQIVRETALEILVPVARTATRQAAQYAVRRGPQLARDTIAPKLTDTLGPAIREAGGPGAFAKGALSSISSARTGMLEKVGIGGESPPRPWRDRRLPVEESIDVVVPLESAYHRFTEFDEYAKFMSRGETVDERPSERIAWERTDGVEASAVITFHRLSDRLTRVMVTYDHQPEGLLEHTTSLFPTSRRGLHADLMRFKAFVEMTDEDISAPEEELEGEYEEEPAAEEQRKPRPAPRRRERRRPPAARKPKARTR